MHTSYFWVIDESSVSKDDLTLAADLSEWLFHIGYWARLSSEGSLAYDQYEEEVMPPTQIAAAISHLLLLLDRLKQGSENPIRFTYGWDANKRPLDCVTTVESLTEGATALVALMRRAASAERGIYCQL